MFLGQRSEINSSAYLTYIPRNVQIDIKIVITSYFKAGTDNSTLKQGLFKYLKKIVGKINESNDCKN